MKLRILLFLALSSFVYTEDEITYEGLRLDISALTMNRDILATLKPAFERTKNHTFEDVRQHDPLSSLMIKNIHITEAKLNERTFKMEEFKFDYPIYTLTGGTGAMYFKIAFFYTMTWLGLTLAKGKGVGMITNQRNEIMVLYNETDPDVKIIPPWHVTSIEINNHIFSPKDWIKTVLEKRFIGEFDKVLDDCMFDFAHKLLYNYREINDSFPNETDLVFRNEIIDVKATKGNSYLSIGFKTNIIVDQDYTRKVIRRQQGKVAPRNDFDYCLSVQMIPDTIDLLGKSGYYNEIVPLKKWRFASNSVKELYRILPRLQEDYDPSYTFHISCKTSHTESVNDLKHKDNPDFHKYLYPYHCYFLINEDPKLSPLNIKVYINIFYEPVVGPNEKALYANVRYAELAGFVETPALPVSKKKILSEHVEGFCGYFTDKKLASPGISVIPNRADELVWDGSYLNPEEVCYHYDEKE